MGKVGAPKGNKNAEKWTLEMVEALFDEAEKKIPDQDQYLVKEDIVLGYKYDFIGELLLDVGTNIDMVDHFLNRFPELESNYKRLKRAMERNCYSNTKKGIINTAVGIVNLKSNHGWTDRQDITSKDKQIDNNVTVNFVDGE